MPRVEMPANAIQSILMPHPKDVQIGLLKAKLSEAQAALDALSGAEKLEGKRPTPKIQSV